MEYRVDLTMVRGSWFLQLVTQFNISNIAILCWFSLRVLCKFPVSSYSITVLNQNNIANVNISSFWVPLLSNY